MLSLSGIRARMKNLELEFGINSQIVKTAKQFVRSSIDDEFIDKSGNVSLSAASKAAYQSGTHGLLVREEVINKYIPTVNDAYGRTISQLEEEINTSTSNNSNKNKAKKPVKITVKKIKASKDSDDNDDSKPSLKSRAKEISNRMAEKLVNEDIEKLSNEVYEAGDEEKFSKQAEAIALREDMKEARKSKNWTPELIADMQRIAIQYRTEMREWEQDAYKKANGSDQMEVIDPFSSPVTKEGYLDF